MRSNNLDRVGEKKKRARIATASTWHGRFSVQSLHLTGIRQSMV